MILVVLIYIFEQILHIFWHLKPNKNLLNGLLDGAYYCKTHRSNLNNKWFEHHNVFKVYVIPKSLLQFMIWALKYGLYSEIPEISKKEKELYEEFCKTNKLQTP